MFKMSKMRTVNGRAVGDEAVIGELVRYKRDKDDSARRARIVLLESEGYDFDTLFEISQEFMGFVQIGDYDKCIAEIAEELRLVGLFCNDEKKITEALNEMMIISPKKNRAILAPDIRALTSFENTLFFKDEYEEEFIENYCGFSNLCKKRFK